jgi:CheY-like chemotaxis protein
LRAGERFDLALLDMQMPGMDGLMLASEIRKLPGGNTLPLVLLASMGVHSDHPGVASAAFASCLTKPIKPAQLHEALLRAISGAKPPAQTAPASSKLDPTLATRLPLRVLLCDDNVVNQKVAVRLLQQMGYRADLAANGVEALAALDRQPYDLVFMDVMMPEMSGLEVTRFIRERQKQRSQFPNYKSPIVIIAMTANAMQGDREKCIAAGMDDYVAKPVRLEDIRAIVERWGAAAGAGETSQSASTASRSSPVPCTPAQPQAAQAQSQEAPVDMERLLDFSDGNPEGLRELVTLYLDQTRGQLAELEAAVRAGAPQEVRRLAHSCAGASATCGMRRIVPLLRELERQGFEGKLVNTDELYRKTAAEFGSIRQFLEAYLATHANLVPKAQP